MEYLGDFLKMVVPSALVLYAMYLVVRTLVMREVDQKSLELKLKSRETVLPLRLQAYERVILFLERNAIGNILAREQKPGQTAAQLHHKLVSTIRDEFNHNLSQQLYMSDKAWELVSQAKEQTISMINQNYSKMDPASESRSLAKGLIDQLIKENQDPHHPAILFIKKEIRELY